MIWKFVLEITINYKYKQKLFLHILNFLQIMKTNNIFEWRVIIKHFKM